MSLVCTNIASEHGKIERSSMSQIIVVIDISMSTFETVSPAVTFVGGTVNWGRVITKIIVGIIILVEYV